MEKVLHEDFLSVSDLPIKLFNPFPLTLGLTGIDGGPFSSLCEFELFDCIEWISEFVDSFSVTASEESF